MNVKLIKGLMHKPNAYGRAGKKGEWWGHEICIGTKNGKGGKSGEGNRLWFDVTYREGKKRGVGGKFVVSKESHATWTGREKTP